MANLRRLLFGGLVTGALWAITGGMIAFVLLPVYLYGVRPWEYGFHWRILWGPGSPGAPSAEQVLQAAAGFALLGAAVGFLGGFLAGMQRTLDADGK